MRLVVSNGFTNFGEPSPFFALQFWQIPSLLLFAVAAIIAIEAALGMRRPGGDSNASMFVLNSVEVAWIVAYSFISLMDMKYDTN